MSDQMPDEVWLRRIGTWVQYPEGEHRYIRADLYEQTEAERDRLRAALEAIRDWPEDWRRDGWAVAQEFQGIAQEALDHE